MKIEEVIFVEYSVKQKFFHYENLDRIIKFNRNLVNKSIESGYVIIGGPFKTMEEASIFTDEYQKKYNLPNMEI